MVPGGGAGRGFPARNFADNRDRLTTVAATMKLITSRIPVFAVAICAILSSAPVSPAKEPGKTADDFSSSKLSDSWKAAKGNWSVEDGRLMGVELAADKHAAVLTYVAPHTDSKVSFSFALAGSKGFSLSFNHAKGHLFRVGVSESEVNVRTDKDKKDPSSKSVLLDKKSARFKQGETHTITCETKGDTVTVTVDGKGPTLTGTHAALAKEKTGYRLVLKGEGVFFDDFVVLK